MSDVKNTSDAAAIISAVRESAKAELQNISRGSSFSAAVLVRPTETDLQSLKPFLDEYLEAPERIKGVSQHDTLNSFLAHAATFKQDRSAIFASISQGALKVIYDYTAPGKPSFCEHGAAFTAKPSRQWQTWNRAAANEMNQAEFAEFIEANALDLIDPPQASAESTGADLVILDIARTLNSIVASASKVIELARGLTVHEASTAKSHYDPATGQRSLEYTTEHKDAKGEKLKVPGLFVIAIPVYEGEYPYRIVVRLRYRVKDGAVKWGVQLYQPEKFLEDAFNGLCEQAETITELPVYRGTADR